MSAKKDPSTVNWRPRDYRMPWVGVATFANIPYWIVCAHRVVQTPPGWSRADWTLLSASGALTIYIMCWVVGCFLNGYRRPQPTPGDDLIISRGK